MRNEEFQDCSTLAQNGNRRASSWYIQTKVRHCAKFPDYLAGEGGKKRRTIVYRKAELENIRTRYPIPAMDIP